ncbi:MAG: Histidine kinase [Bacilli bacterium]|nr:Histidine kinase [Bacilli bacterium]
MLRIFVNKIFIAPIALYQSINKSLKYKLIMYFMLLSAIPIIITVVIVYKMTSLTFEKRVIQSSTDMIMGKIGYFDSYIREINNILSEETYSADTLNYLRLLNSNDSTLKDNSEILDRLAAQLDYIISFKSNLVNSIMILPADHNKYPISRGKYNYITAFNGDYRDSPVYKRTITIKGLEVWDFSFNVNSKDYFATASSVLINQSENQVLGIAIIFLNVDQIKNIFDNANSSNGELYVVMDQKNQIIYNSDKSKIGKLYSDTALLSKIGNLSSGSFKADLNGVRNVVTVYTSENSGWKIINAVPYKYIVKDVNQIAKITLWVASLCLLVVFLTAMKIYFSLYNPIKKLSISMNKLGKTNLNIQVVTKRTDEIGLLTNRFNYMTDRITMLINDVEKEQIQKKENEIKALQSQITPHFIYNTLNAVKTTVLLGRNENANEMIIDLISLLKAAARNTSNFIALNEELNYVKSYISIMQYRYDKHFIVSYNVDYNLLDAKVLKFILQPVIENCIIHAFEKLDSNNQIVLRVKGNRDYMEIEIQDNGVGMSSEQIEEYMDNNQQNSDNKFSQIGLRNIDERIKLNCGEQFGITLLNNLDEGTIVRIKLPVIN